jgi:dCTP deaminase
VEVDLALEPLFPDRIATGEGILPSQEILHLVHTGKISSSEVITEDQIQPSSIDLRLSNEAYRVRASLSPGRSTTLLHKAKANGLIVETIDISDGALFEPDAIYIVPLMETLDLPANVYGIANPKSSTGRLDIFTRLIPQFFEDEFDRLRNGYSGNLYIEIVSQTFPIVVRAGMKLNQLRFGRGRRGVVGDDRLRRLDQNAFLINPDEETGQATIDRGLRLTVDLQGNGSEIIGYKARRDAPPIDLDLINHYDVPDFWIPMYRGDECILQPGEFYILASKQRVRVPPDLAAEMLPYDLATQEFRVHYAGFFDPGFGYGADGEVPGTRAVLEVRANEMPILLEDDQFVGRLNYFNMSARPRRVYGGLIGSNYQQQGLTLSKQFKRQPVVFSSRQELKSETSNGVAPPNETEDLEPDDDSQTARTSIAFTQGAFEQWRHAKPGRE